MIQALAGSLHGHKLALDATSRYSISLHVYSTEISCLAMCGAESVVVGHVWY